MKRFSSLVAGLLVSVSAFAQNADVMLQGFDAVSYQNSNGWYNVVSSKAAELKQAGINTIWLPPPSESTGGMGYLPKNYYNLNNSHGSQSQLQACIANMHANNVKVLADIVVNHRVGQTGWADFYNPSWGAWAVCKDDEWASNGGNPTGNYDTGEQYGAGRDLDHTNVGVQNDIKSWLYWLKNTIGFDGWRYDLVKGFSPYYVGIYNDASSPYFSVGEYFDGNRQLVQNWVDGTSQKSAAFDFPLKFNLMSAVNGNYGLMNSGGQMNGLAGWSPSKAVTFIDNHDTYNANTAFPSDNGKTMQGYAYILTHPGIPMVFWDHYFDWGLKDQINALIQIRHWNAISATSSCSIQASQSDLYAAIINSNVAMKMGPGAWSPSGSGWYLKSSGNNYAVWDRTAPCTTPTLTLTPSGTGIGNYNVTATATGNIGTPLIFYTTDGSNPTLNSPSAAGSKTWSFTAPSTTLKAFAYMGTCGSPMQTMTYNVVYPDFSVFFQKPSGWAAGAPKVYYWNQVGGSMAAVTYPGVAMTAYSGNWYKFTFKGVQSTSLLFTDGSATNKTADLTRSSFGVYSGTTWSTTRPAVTYTMDGNLDACATLVASSTGCNLYADYNGTTLYLAATKASGTTNDVFMHVASALGAATAAPWAKSGTVPGGCSYIANESTNNFAAWTGGGAGAVTGTSASGTFVEGTLIVGNAFPSATQLYLALAQYGTADGGTLQKQAPAAVTVNGSLESTEFWLMNLSAF